jgi:hypothetical protein
MYHAAFGVLQAKTLRVQTTVAKAVGHAVNVDKDGMVIVPTVSAADANNRVGVVKKATETVVGHQKLLSKRVPASAKRPHAASKAVEETDK